MSSSIAASSFEKPHGKTYTYYPVVIVGAGASGIALGCQLKEKLGFDQFRIFDKQSQLGGTWHINRYPGIACDIPAIFYSFSFLPNYKCSSFYPPGKEILQYLADVCRKYKIVDKIQLNTEVKEARWLQDEEVWELVLMHMAPGAGDLSVKERQTKIELEGEGSVYVRQEIVRAKIFASGVGALVEPEQLSNNIPGWDTFKGKVFHSARWDYDVDLKDKDVVVVGTGCSAAQFVPKLLAEYEVNSIIQLMRSPPWVTPRPSPPFGVALWNRWSSTVLGTIPGLGALFRFVIFLGTEYDWRLFGNDNYGIKEREKEEQKLLSYMKGVVPGKYHDLLTPNYGVGCKRRVLDEAWFSSLNNPKIELTTRSLVGIRPHGIMLGPDPAYPSSNDVPNGIIERSADVVILANGYTTTTWLHPLKIIGKNGKDIHSVWKERQGPQAYLGTAMDGFPNFFIIFGPNTVTGHSSVILAIELMVAHSLKFIKPILKREIKTVEIKEEAERKYSNDIQEKLKHTVWNDTCGSWYKRADGFNSMAYPYSQWYFGYRCMFPKWNDWDIRYTQKGLLKKRIRNVLSIAFYFNAVLLFFLIRRSDKSVVEVVDGYATMLGLQLKAASQMLRNIFHG